MKKIFLLLPLMFTWQTHAADLIKKSGTLIALNPDQVTIRSGKKVEKFHPSEIVMKNDSKVLEDYLGKTVEFQVLPYPAKEAN